METSSCAIAEPVIPAFEHMVGLPAADIIGRSVREVTHGLGTDWTEAYGKVARSGKTVQLEVLRCPQAL